MLEIDYLESETGELTKVLVSDEEFKRYSINHPEKRYALELTKDIEGFITHQASDENYKQERCLKSYQQAINKIDDYFEYRYKSKEDQKIVYNILDELTENLKQIVD